MAKFEGVCVVSLPKKWGFFAGILIALYISNPVYAFGIIKDMPVVPMETLIEKSVDSLEVVPMSTLKSTLIPAYYESPYVTSVKNQGSLGSCGSFAAISALEANAKKDGLLGSYDSDPDYSELAFGWYAVNGKDGLDGLWPHVGALQTSRWIGPVLENGNVNGFPIAYPGSKQGLENIDDSIFNAEWATEKDAVHVQNFYQVKSSDQNDVKDLVLEYGAATISLYMDQSNFSDSPKSDGRYSFNQNGLSESGHAVAIVGWDDNYAVSNFKVQPSKPGAWLVKNSWGTNATSAAPYFWVSYESYKLAETNSTVFDVEPANNYDEIQQVGSGTTTEPSRYSGYSGANIFTASGDGAIKAVGFYCWENTFDFTISIYKNISSEGDPDDGELAFMQSGNKRYTGYNTVKLDAPVSLSSGERYSVVLTIIKNDTKYAYAELQKSRFNDFLEPLTVRQSYIGSAGGSWADLKSSTRACVIKAYLDESGFEMINDAFNVTVGDEVIVGKLTDDSPSSVVWSSSNPSVASVDANGVVKALKKGTSTISARYNAITYTCTVKVSVRYTELSGITRYVTGTAAALDAYPDGSDGVIIASGMNFPDALSATGLAGLLDYPILLTDPYSLPGEVGVAIDALKGDRNDFTVVISGGTSAVSDTVKNQLTALCGSGSVSRLSGGDRFETALQLYTYGRQNSQWYDRAIICLGTDFPDALSISPYAFAQKTPVFLTRSDGTLTANTLSAIQSGGFHKILIVGGTGVIPDSIKTTLGSSFTYERLGGATRYDTSLAVASWSVGKGIVSWNSTGFATGRNYPDALVGGPMQGKKGGVLLLADSGTTNGTIALSTLPSKDIRCVYWYGGTAVVPETLRSAIRTSIG